MTPLTASLVASGGTGGVTGTDGRTHVMYELVLTNATLAPADLKTVTVRDPGGIALRTMTGSEMLATEALRMLDRSPATSTSIAPGATRILLVSLAFPSKAAMPASASHDFSVEGLSPLARDPATPPSLLAFRAASVPLDGPAPLALAPPLEGTGWFASQAPPTPDSHQSALIPFDGVMVAAERFAVDFIRVDDQGRILTGDRSVVTNWFGYGARVLAVGDGVVTEVQDGLPDQVPGPVPELPADEIPGNFVTLKLADGYSVMYCHLKAGSIPVAPGQTVRPGDLLGLLGNSGGTSAPHLHLHAVVGPRGASTDGIPYVFSTFSLAGVAPPGALLASLDGGAGFPPRSSLSPVPRVNQLPLGDDIVDFPTP